MEMDLIKHFFSDLFSTPFRVFRWELKFIRSDFRGQLPKPYSSYPNATKIIPTEMNDMNKEEESRYVSQETVAT
jgi:alpha-1,2-mannosyltransferase